MSISQLLAGLYEYRGADVFNQYAETDPDMDIPGGDKVRRENLLTYLEAFKGAKYVLVGEAPSFHGCRFSGIPFTSEELLVGEKQLAWAAAAKFMRSSTFPKPKVEMSASIVWGLLGLRRDFVLWNAFPWHAHPKGINDGNRKPTHAELSESSLVLQAFVQLYPGAKIVAIGRTAEYALQQIGKKAEYIRHPSMGGKEKFAEGILRLRG
jgi:uracil-DNA glycosylase